MLLLARRNLLAARTIHARSDQPGGFEPELVEHPRRRRVVDEMRRLELAQAKCPGTGGDCIDFWTRRAKGLEKVWTSSLEQCTP